MALLHFVKSAVPHAVNVLSSISICVCACILRMPVHVHSPDWELAGCWPTLSCFHFSFTPHEQPQGSCFLFIFLLFPFSSQYLPGNNWDMNHFRQGGAQLWEQNSRYKSQGDGENFILIPTAEAADEFTRAPCVSMFTFAVVLFKHQRWAGNARYCMQGKHKNIVLFLYNKIYGTNTDVTVHHYEMRSRSCRHCIAARL